MPYRRTNFTCAGYIQFSLVVYFAALKLLYSIVKGNVVAYVGYLWIVHMGYMGYESYRLLSY